MALSSKSSKSDFIPEAGDQQQLDHGLKGGPAVAELPNLAYPLTSASISPQVNSAWSYRDALAKPRLPISVSTVPEKSILPSLTNVSKEPPDFAFISDPDTLDYLAGVGSKLMIILRGVSGSGKSTLCVRIKKELTEAKVQVDVASADHFFNQPDGTYRFNPALLQQAHEACQRDCERFCAAEESRVVVVDNTNIFEWEFRPYIQLAHRYHFVTLLIEPRTAWRYDWRQLAKRSTHGVQASVIESKVEKLKRNVVIPVYYGFMVSADDSGKLRLLAAKLARTMLQVDELSQAADGEADLLVNEFAKRSDDELVAWKESDQFHCTAFYTAFGKRLGASEYDKSVVVQQNLGKHHGLEVLGLLVTPQTISFHVRLNEGQLRLWKQEENVKTPGLPPGSRAHLTVVTAKGIEAVQAGHDTLKLAELTALGKPQVTSSIAAGTVFKYAEDFWYLARDKPMVVDTVFGGFYSSR
ncbi:putative 2',3'-cyclic-nucleotide 3'-phosphodiesterase [Hypsibius exemplaris]|uniref:2',3'-cyclic-nucleotide 3'-phosphodiesterase n=1 Tax=Hypsibius exemplaris TaxID=2072580 RepID=A0A1W0WMG9_HYPEX|nr:putative 2',3'-cyclic-nucleotide 3'-phosphodiesterase [Hypsibius exemplaris]